jgi:hypothetical protein
MAPSSDENPADTRRRGGGPGNILVKVGRVVEQELAVVDRKGEL